MKNLVFFLSFLFIFTGAFAQKGDKTISRWNNYATDEEAIPQSDFQFNKKSNLYYLTSNDEQNFYIDIRIEDTKTETKILSDGLVFWINADGKSQKDKGIRFPIGTENAKRPYIKGANLPLQTESGVPKSPIAQANTVELIGYPEKEGRFLPSSNPDNVRGSVRYNDQGILHYRLIIPVDKLNLEPAKDGKGTIPFTLGIEIGAEVIGMMGPGTKPAGPPAGAGAGIPPAGAGAGIPSGGGGRAGGGGPGGPGGSPAGGIPAVNAGTTNPVLWIKDLGLAYNTTLN